MVVTIRDIYRKSAQHMNKTVTLGGWVRTVRDNKNFGFIELHDGSCFKSLQVVFDQSIANFADIAKLGVGASIRVTGAVVESLGAKQPFEVKAAEVVIEGVSPSEYPLQKKRHTLEYLRTIAHLRPRTNTFQAVFRLRSIASYAIHKFFNDRHFVHVHTPILTGSDCEGAGEMFRVTTLNADSPQLTKEGKADFGEDFFGKMASLTVSGQLSAETFAMAFRDVYTFGPTFRAENSNTPRHAAEFWMLEPEIAFADLSGCIRLAEDLLKYVIAYVLEYAAEEMAFFNNFIDKGIIERLEKIVSADFGVVTYTEAIDLLTKSGAQFEYPVKWGMDLQTEHERYLTEQIYKKPLFVTDYPKDIKAFYMRLNDDGKTVAATDLLVPGVGELIGGSQREERADVLLARIEAMGMEPADYWWYMDLRKYGTVKHAGFGLGFERLLMYMTGMSNIRDVIPYPRTVNYLEF